MIVDWHGYGGCGSPLLVVVSAVSRARTERSVSPCVLGRNGHERSVRTTGGSSCTVASAVRRSLRISVLRGIIVVWEGFEILGSYYFKCFIISLFSINQ